MNADDRARLASLIAAEEHALAMLAKPQKLLDHLIAPDRSFGDLDERLLRPA